MAVEPQRYEILRGLNWTATDGTPQRAEPDEVRDDLLRQSIKWLEADGLIRKTSKPLTRKGA